MTDRELLELAREADPGFEGGPDADGTLGDSLVGIAAITRFAALVRAFESVDPRRWLSIRLTTHLIEPLPQLLQALALHPLKPFRRLTDGLTVALVFPVVVLLVHRCRRSIRFCFCALPRLEPSQ